MRRIANVLGESSSSSSSRQQNETQTNNHPQQQQPPPPDYNAVLVEMNRSVAVTDSPDRRTQELAIASQSSSALTAADVASILRNSFRRSTVRNAFRARVSNDSNTGSMSAENLVDHVAPVGETSLVLERRSNDGDGDETRKIEDSSSVI